MAADGDCFQKRVAYGLGKVYTAVCEGAAPTEISGLLLGALRNMLRSRDLRTPTLGPLIAVAHAFLAGQPRDWFPEGRLEQEAQLRAKFDEINRAFPDCDSSPIARRACEAAVIDLLDRPEESLSEDQIADHCCEHYCEALFGRFGFDPMQCALMRKRGFSREEMEQFRAEAIAIIKPQAIRLLRGVAESKSGLPPRRKLADEGTPIENTAHGLEEAFVALP
jgi:hypothetical protein